MKKVLKIFLILFGLFFSFDVRGAALYFTNNLIEYRFRDVFLVSLNVDTEKEKINAGQIEINFPADKLRVVEVIKDNSIFKLWPEEPKISKEKISFVGGIPAGFEGKGKILTIAFEVILSDTEKTTATLNFSENCLILLNDGFGTRANLKTEGKNFLLFSEQREKPKNELNEFLLKDNNPPQAFDIFLVKTPLIFNHKYFITFFTVDDESGIDHYEIQEGEMEWKKTVYNFYLLENQELKGEIKVKAIDKAGNERVSILKLS